jgi:hypothetical protein
MNRDLFDKSGLRVFGTWSFYVQNILESNPKPVRWRWKTFVQSWEQFNEKSYKRERERLEAIRIELRYLALAVQVQSKLHGIQ